MSDWVEKDLRYIWHPYTQMKDCEELAPILIERAEGVKLYDEGGNFYYDTISSWWCNVHGHNHPKINAAIAGQLERLEHVLFAGFTHRGAIELAEKLVSITPEGLTKVFYSDDGSTSVEVALKMSFQYRQNTGQEKKRKFVSLDLAYHGDTIGAMSVGGETVFNRVFDALRFETLKVPSPYCYRCPMGKERRSCNIDCLGPLAKVLEEKSEEITALILEPLMMGAAGMVVYPVEYLTGAAELAKENGVHLIVDEVATGFGRTGKMFACEHGGVEPDFMCLSKGLTSGTVPLAVTLTTEEIYGAFYDDYEKGKTFYHGHTFTANAVGCAAALASLEIFEEEKTLEHVEGLIPILHNGMEKMRELRFVGDIRCIGMVGAVELVMDKETKEAFSAGERRGYEVFKAGLSEHLILRPLGDVIYLVVPLSITREELEDVLSKTYKVISGLGG